MRAAKTRPGLWRGVFVAPLACAAATGGPEACPVAGELPHWQADWCMALLGTDDEIAAWPCIEQEMRLRPGDDCRARLRYKRDLCGWAAAAGTYPGTTEACSRDPGFTGPTVRNGGIRTADPIEREGSDP